MNEKKKKSNRPHWVYCLRATLAERQKLFKKWNEERLATGRPMSLNEYIKRRLGL